jgi:calcium/calmodulin-dependent protein kinase I
LAFPRDLKLENLLYYDDAEDSKVMVADFGLSEWLWEIQDGSPICGTPGYMAPEVIRDKRVTPAADVWSIGVITYILLAGYPPFVSSGRNNAEDEDQDAICRLITKGRYEFHAHSWSHISAEAKDFISRVMCVDPSERPSCVEALEHPWLSSSQRPAHSLGADLGTDVRKALDSGRRWSAHQTLSFALSAAIIVGSYLSLIAYIFNLKLMSE